MTRTLFGVFTLLAALPVCLFAQGKIDVELSNGPGLLAATSTQLQFTGGILVSASQNGQPPFIAGGVGSVTFTTPALAPGVIAHGGSFGPGGSFYISSPYGVDINATFVSGTWRRIVLANHTNEYELTAQIKGTMFLNGTTYNIEGMTVQASTNTGKALFAGNQPSSGGVTDVIVVP